ncbi:MAG: DNA damage-inducible protein D [Ignavibacteria bacterium GWB2_35_12]|nr:MAG: DNA damage-inducible protein D [Ignavibacteria bacterium GWA2_35_8]OGU39165.1 MAG: DNA damage-inducible protein D [Ignavibacteria bacterium GWB2_35_12]OGU89193.1 MAG: DNA damage-inducible protein D [Ignavibacteria bacterium RIFOXYA2_FULL_35_10]OGV21031.1 MAG: DNA damage-inducible protein D [Ignavibacteria bacterium RIFOXYC2_FULL_35_21]
MNNNYEIEKVKSSVFEDYKKVNEYGQEYWSARDFFKILEYTDWRKFINVINKAKESCNNSGQKDLDHFVRMDKMVQIGSGAERNIGDLHLSRYACYLIVQNADPSKKVVAIGQTYFAVQTRKQEIQELKEYLELKTEDDKRLFLREELKKHNLQLASVAKDAGVIEPYDYAIFQDHGYRGLYGGLGAKDIHKKKLLKKSQQILDHMGSTELAANLFRATQTEEKLKRENIKGKHKANKAHFDVGVKVRKTIKEIGGTMPEDLPSVDSIKKIEQKKKKTLNAPK